MVFRRSYDWNFTKLDRGVLDTMISDFSWWTSTHRVKYMVPPWKYRTWVADLWDFRNISSQMNVAWKKVKFQPIAKMVGVWAFYSRKKLGEYWWSLFVGGYHPFCCLQSLSGHLSKSQIVCHWLTSSPSTYHPKIPVICGYVWKKLSEKKP